MILLATAIQININQFTILYLIEINSKIHNLVKFLINPTTNNLKNLNNDRIRYRFL